MPVTCGLILADEVSSRLFLAARQSVWLPTTEGSTSGSFLGAGKVLLRTNYLFPNAGGCILNCVLRIFDRPVRPNGNAALPSRGISFLLLVFRVKWRLI